MKEEYTNEEVSEIIKVALRNTDHSKVSREEMLAIGKEFNLSDADIVRASEQIAASREEIDYAEKKKQTVWQDFKLHVVCYVAGIAGFFFVNLITSPEFWWFLVPMSLYGPIVAIHGFLAKYNQDLAYTALRWEDSDEISEMTSMSSSGS
jgi:hypothetical protein